jgi:hypothetical protein
LGDTPRISIWPTPAPDASVSYTPSCAVCKRVPVRWRLVGRKGIRTFTASTAVLQTVGLTRAQPTQGIPHRIRTCIFTLLRRSRMPIPPEGQGTGERIRTSRFQGLSLLRLPVSPHPHSRVLSELSLIMLISRAVRERALLCHSDFPAPMTRLERAT